MSKELRPCPSCAEKDKRIEYLTNENVRLDHVLSSILNMAKRNNGVLYFRQNNGIWKIETGKDIDVSANDTDNNVENMEE